MGGSIADLIIKVSADTADAVKGLGGLGSKIKGSMGGAARSLGKVTKYAAIAAGAGGIGAVVGVLKAGIPEWKESTKVAAQTAAVVKSTGGVAHVTAGHVDKLSASLLAKSGVDDEVIKSGANMLLTFTNIRNEVGRGNDIFDRATKTVLDMSVALGQDTKSSAVQLGKALNDPIKGVTALQRVGVSFTAAQKDQIKAMVEAGNTMGAQKLILGELNKEFGGSAEAMGKTLPGQISILKEGFLNLAGGIVAGLMPAFQGLVTWATAHMPEIQATIQTVMAAISTAVGAAAGFISDHWNQIVATFQAVKAGVEGAVHAIGAVAEWLVGQYQAHAAEIAAAWATIQAAAQRVKAWYESDLQPAIQNVVAALTAIWNRFGGDIKRITEVAFKAVAAVVKADLTIVKDVVNFILAVLRGDWGKAWESLKDIPVQVLHGIVALIKGMVGIFTAAAEALGKAILDGLKAGTAALLGWAKGKLGDLVSAVRGFAGQMLSAAASIGKAIIDGIKSGVEAAWGGLVSYVQGKMEALKAAVKKPWKIFSPSQTAAEEIGKPIMQGIAVGMDAGTADVLGAIDRSSMAVLGFGKGKFYDVGNQVGVELAHGVIAGFDAMKGLLTSAISAVMDAVYQEFERNFTQKATDLAAKLGGRGPSLNIPGFAGGVTNFGGGMAVVGERGPELVNLPRGADVFSNRDSSAMMGGRQITVNVNGATAGQLDENALMAILRRAEVLHG